uniref:A-kinase anchor protein 7 n=1 Tax=Rhipicephalus appendiculatus TaxID=34631 RepID=A0A131YJX3_RHIAP
MSADCCFACLQTQEVGDEHNVAGASAASTPSKRRCCRPRKRQKRSGKSAIASQQRSVSDDGSSSDESCAVVGDERDGEGLVADGWISELPAGLISSADTEDDDNDPVYSLKPLFTGKYGSSSSAKKSKPSKDNRPNYFVAIQVDDVNVHKAAKKVQDHMRSLEPNIERALISIPTLHITLLVLRVNDEDDSLQRAKDSLSRAHQAVKDGLEATPLTLQFEGLDHFRKEVLYVKAIGEDSVSRLEAIAQICREEFEKSNLDLSGNKAFAPHLTLAKLSKQSRRKNGIKKIQEEWYAAFKDESFGTQKVNSLQLLSMLKPKDERGYYYCSMEHTFGDFSRDQENNDHSECCVPAPSRASQRNIEQKLLKIDAAKEEIKRAISTLTNAKLQQLSIAKQEPAEAEPELSEKNFTEVSEDETST